MISPLDEIQIDSRIGKLSQAKLAPVALYDNDNDYWDCGTEGCNWRIPGYFYQSRHVLVTFCAKIRVAVIKRTPNRV